MLIMNSESDSRACVQVFPLLAYKVAAVARGQQLMWCVYGDILVLNSS